MAIREYIVKITDEVIPDGFERFENEYAPEGQLVRCKDCKYAYLTDDGECKYCEMEKDDNGFLIERYSSWDWFCADGERKEGR